MDRNFFLAFALSFLVLTLWSLWQGGRQSELVPEGETSGMPTLEAPLAEDPRGLAERAVIPETSPLEVPVVEAPPELAVEAARSLEVETPLFRAEFSTRGAALTRWELAHYYDASLPERPAVELTTLERGEAALTTPFRGVGRGDQSAAAFVVERHDPYEVVFKRDADGILLRKAFRFEPDSYAFRLRIEVENRAQHEVEPSFEVVWPARTRRSVDFADHTLVALNEGDVERTPVASVGSPGFFSRLSGGGGDTGPEVYRGEVDWAGAQTRYFLSVLMPDVPRDAEARFEALTVGEAGAAAVSFRPVRLPPGRRLEREYRVYIGPKESDRLEAVGANLDRSIDRGWAWVSPLTAAFSWLLKASYSVIPNYGLAIILITVMVRLCTAPLMAKQMRSMKRMGELQPQMKALQEKYADDRQKQSEELMKLYKQSGVNPLGGCFPMLLQLPVFIGLYYALQSSIALRQEPFALWINDLSAPETLFVIPGLELPVRVLPLLMGASMVLQQRLTPTTVDPAQARMMMTVMPVMFTVLFYQFPSGLVLYWFVSNLLGIGHQLWVNRGGRGRPAESPKQGQREKKQARRSGR